MLNVESIEELLKRPESELKRALYKAILDAAWRKALEAWLKNLPVSNRFSNIPRGKKLFKMFLQEFSAIENANSALDDANNKVSNEQKNNLLARIVEAMSSLEKDIKAERTVVSEQMAELNALEAAYPQRNAQGFHDSIRDNRAFHDTLQQQGITVDEADRHELVRAITADDIPENSSDLSHNIADAMLQHAPRPVEAENEETVVAQQQQDFRSHMRHAVARVESLWTNRQAPRPEGSLNLEQLLRTLFVNRGMVQNMHTTFTMDNLRENIATRVVNLHEMQHKHNQYLSLIEDLRNVKDPRRFARLENTVNSLSTPRNNQSMTQEGPLSIALERLTAPRPTLIRVR